MFVPFLPLLSCHPLPPYSFPLLSVLLLNRCLIPFYTIRNQSQTPNRKSVCISTDLLSNEFVNVVIHDLLPGASCSQKAMMIHLNLGVVFVDFGWMCKSPITGAEIWFTLLHKFIVIHAAQPKAPLEEFVRCSCYKSWSLVPFCCAQNIFDSGVVFVHHIWCGSVWSAKDLWYF